MIRYRILKLKTIKQKDIYIAQISLMLKNNHVNYNIIIKIDRSNWLKVRRYYENTQTYVGNNVER